MTKLDDIVERAAEAYWYGPGFNKDESPDWESVDPFLKSSIKDGIRAALKVLTWKDLFVLLDRLRDK